MPHHPERNLGMVWNLAPVPIRSYAKHVHDEWSTSSTTIVDRVCSFCGVLFTSTHGLNQKCQVTWKSREADPDSGQRDSVGCHATLLVVVDVGSLSFLLARGSASPTSLADGGPGRDAVGAANSRQDFPRAYLRMWTVFRRVTLYTDVFTYLHSVVDVSAVAVVLRTQFSFFCNSNIYLCRNYTTTLPSGAIALLFVL